ncbi:nuclear pore complex-interacting protein family member B11 isoform X4 [Oncorhynchus tshawytscha]|uniref:nuclear pore complex-interacting protein family member B11 isoform X4 n=1 Tax=Oncorhynchus tshawytscha TaxID=74940 RepID=UPI001C3CA3AC|nr:nuclear pore complex-interacting protein family member B11 isoform X4 [Oncorhynchus tshawytscha]
MANTGRCCASLEQPKALMKMGLSMVLVGHVNFLLGALVHGAVLRHINLNTRAHTMAYSISNIMALTTGLVGVVVGMLTILLSKNKKSRVLSMTLILWVPLIVICIVQLVLSVRCFSVCVSFLGLPCFPHKIRLRDHGRTINTVAPAEPPSLTSSVPGHSLHLHLLQSDLPHLKSQRRPLPPPPPPPPPLHHSDPSHLKSQRQPLPPPPPLHHSDPSHLKSQRQPLRPPPPLHHSDPSHLKSQRQPLPPPLHHSNPSHLKSQRQPLPPPPPLHHSDPSHLKSQRQPLRPQHQTHQRGSSDRWSDGGQLVPPEEHELLEQGFWI